MKLSLIAALLLAGCSADKDPSLSTLASGDECVTLATGCEQRPCCEGLICAWDSRSGHRQQICKPECADATGCATGCCLQADSTRRVCLPSVQCDWRQS